MVEEIWLNQPQDPAHQKKPQECFPAASLCEITVLSIFQGWPFQWH